MASLVGGEPLSNEEKDEEYEDIEITTALIRRTTNSTSFLGMPRMQLRFWKSFSQVKAFAHMVMQMEQHTLTLLDARRRSLDYETVGFKLHPLTSQVKEWQQAAVEGTEDNLTYKAELEKVVRELHPGVKRIAFMSFLLRGGEGENAPAAGTIHLDMYPDDEVSEAFRAKHEAKPAKKDGSEDEALSDLDECYADDSLELGLVLGLWKPRNDKNPVLNFPLFMADPNTVEPDDVLPQFQLFEHRVEGKGMVQVVNVAGSLKHSDKQRWYYYPSMTNEELIVFRHKTKSDPLFVNFHAAAGGLALPEGAETRCSIETRAFCFYEKGAAPGS